MTKEKLNTALCQIRKDFHDDKNKHFYSTFETYLMARLIVAAENVRDNTDSIRKDMPPVYSD